MNIGSFFHLLPEELLSIERHIDAGRPFSHTINSVQSTSTKENSNTEFNQSPGVILSSYTTGFLVEGALFPLHQISDASTKNNIEIS